MSVQMHTPWARRMKNLLSWLSAVLNSLLLPDASKTRVFHNFFTKTAMQGEGGGWCSIVLFEQRLQSGGWKKFTQCPPWAVCFLRFNQCDLCSFSLWRNFKVLSSNRPSISITLFQASLGVSEWETQKEKRSQTLERNPDPPPPSQCHTWSQLEKKLTDHRPFTHPPTSLNHKTPPHTQNLLPLHEHTHSCTC